MSRSLQASREAMYLMFEIDREQPFTALGFFNIERSTLTSLVGTILTYLIVLVQFEQSGDHIPTMPNVTNTTMSPY